MKKLCITNPTVRWLTLSLSATNALKGSMLMLILASRIHRRLAAIQSAVESGMKKRAGHRAGKPKNRYSIRVGAEVGIDRAHVGELQSPAELNAQEPEAQVPNLPVTQTWFFHQLGSSLSSSHRLTSIAAVRGARST